MSSLVWNRSLLFVGLVLIATACGQNAHVTGSGGVSEEPGLQQQPPNQTDPANPPSTGKEAQGPQGPAGANGQNGKDGRDGKDGCGIVPYTATFDARSLKPKELASVVLPYRPTDKHKIKTLDLGQYTGTTAEGIRFVKDGQVVVAITANLPPMLAISRNTFNAFLTVGLSKLSSDLHPKTEIFCFLDEKICSGKGFDAATEPTWQGNYNPRFWIDEKKPVNPFFSEELYSKIVPLEGKRRQYKFYGSEALALDLGEMIRGYKVSDPLEFLYDSKPTDQNIQRTLYMAIADDSLIQSVRLSVAFDLDVCMAAELNKKKEHPYE